MPPPDSPALVMLPPANLPSGFGDSLTGKVVRIPDRNVGKQAMVKALSQGHRSRILRGRAALALEGQRVTAVTVRLETGDGVSLGARLVAVAAGCEDIGEQPGIAMHEIVERTTNLLLALPSGNVAAWLNVTRIAEIASALVDPSGAQLQVPGGGNGVEIGCAVED